MTGPFRIVAEDKAISDAPRRRGIGIGASRDYYDEEQAWHSSTGHASARNAHRLSRTRFLREGESSRPWSGRAWVDGDEQREDRQPTPPPQPPPPTIPPPSQPSMADFYAQLTARMGRAGDKTAVGADSVADAHPPHAGSSGTPRKRHKPAHDWFSSASVESNRNVSSTKSVALPPSQSSAPCPTCNSPLPNPCPSTVLRTHLSSLAHRLALTEPTSKPRSAPQTQTATAIEDKLHLDARNKGYVLLQGMGWKEGVGLGVDEWEYLQRQSERQQAEAGQTSSTQETHAGDIFTPRSRSPTPSPPPPSPSPPPIRRKARLTPITPVLKNDRRGLGGGVAAVRRLKKSSAATTSTARRRQREAQSRADRQDLQRIREELR